jgi:flagellar motor switch protein FliN/FliY
MSEARSVIPEDRMASIMDIPVTLSVVLGEQQLPLGKLYTLGRGSIVVFDKRVGELVDILVNDRLIARGEVQLTDDGALAVSMVELATGGLA